MKKLIFLSAIALWLFAATGCEENENNANEPPKMATPKSIVGTWKCIAFGNSETGEERPIKPVNCEECYTITFKQDGTFEGVSEFLDLCGNYKIDHNTIIYSNRGGNGFLYFMGEMEDGDEFRSRFYWSKHYKINNRYLKLYYDKDDNGYYKTKTRYLLFKPKN